MRLARQFGWWDWRAFMDQLSPEQFAEWLALEQVEPTGENRADLRIGLLACAIETLVREKPEWNLSQFMPFSGLTEEDFEQGQSAELQAELWRTLAAGFEGR